jgi:SAM-dependent methyltransferase
MRFGSLVNANGGHSSFEPTVFGPSTFEVPAAARAPLLAAWPLQALACWLLAWGVFLGLHQVLGLDAALGLLAATALGAALSLFAQASWRRLIVALGFPVSLLASGMAGLPAWSWLVPLALLALAYPWQAWRDAPFFPTPACALDQLDRLAPLPPYARVLDAGCGLGHGLAALQRTYPRVLLEGIEQSAPLALAARWRCQLHGPKARVMHGDMWSLDWSDYGMVYLFQRPESLPRAVDKACRELPRGAWLASLEFEATELKAHAIARCPDGRNVWLYRAPFVRRRSSKGS